MASATTEVTVCLVLTKKEALILKEVVQNPLNGETLEKEPIELREWRMSIWDALLPQSDLY